MKVERHTAGGRLLVAAVAVVVAVSACSSTTDSGDPAAVAAVVADAAPWLTELDNACIVTSLETSPAELMDLVEHPLWARDLDTAVEVAVATANCAEPALGAAYAAALELPGDWSSCARAEIDDAVAAGVLAAEMVGDVARAARGLDPFFACVLRTDAEVAVDIGLPGLLTTSGLEDFAPLDGPACVQASLTAAGVAEERIVALLLRETVSEAEIDRFAEALLDCADPDRATAVLAATVGTELEPGCVSDAGYAPARDLLVAALADVTAGDVDDRRAALAAACGR